MDLNDSKGKASESKLEHLKLTDCGLGFIDGDEGKQPTVSLITLQRSNDGVRQTALRSRFPAHLPSLPLFSLVPLDRSVNLLALYLPHLPNLLTLDLTNNSFTHLPPTFIRSLLTHPTLSTLILSANPLGLPPPASPPNSPPAIHALLDALLLSLPLNSPTSSNLKNLHLNLTSLSSITSPLLLRLLQLPRGILDLRLNANALAPLKDLSPLVDTLRGPTGNRFLQNLEIYGCFDEDDLFQSTEKSKELVEELAPYLARNRRLLKGTREAGREVVRVGRVVMLATRKEGGEKEGGGTRRTGGVFPILDLPTELMQPIFSSLYPGALSQKQVARLLGWVGERETLGKGLDGEEVLEEVGCWWWQGGS